MKPIPPDRRWEGIADVDIEDVDDDEEDDRARDAESDVPIESDLKVNEERTNRTVPDPQDDWMRRSVRIARQIGLVIETGTMRKRLTACRLPRMAVTLTMKLTELDYDTARRAIRRELQFRGNHHDTDYAFKMSVRAAMRDRPKKALSVIEAKPQQMHDKRVWHGVHLQSLTKTQQRAIIRSSMFPKDKYSASGAFEKFKARLEISRIEPCTKT